MRTIDDAKIRTEAVFIEAEAKLLMSRLEQLEERRIKLSDEMEFADPLNDRDLDQFILKLARALQCWHALRTLSESANAMQKFRLPLAESVSFSHQPFFSGGGSCVTIN